MDWDKDVINKTASMLDIKELKDTTVDYIKSKYPDAKFIVGGSNSFSGGYTIRIPNVGSIVFNYPVNSINAVASGSVKIIVSSKDSHNNPNIETIYNNDWESILQKIKAKF